ncbi:MAG: hypothetical protein ABIP53_02975 [Candidatus Limnocylindrales bacterium]
MSPQAPRKKPAPKPSSPESGDGLRDILVEAARTQLAAVTAATTFWAGWAEMADSYAKSVSDELARLEREDGDPGDLLGRITDLTREYVRNLTELPTTSVQHFNTQLETIGKRTGKRTRAARVKT